MSSNSFLSCADTRVCNYVVRTCIHKLTFSLNFHVSTGGTTTRLQNGSWSNSQSRSRCCSRSWLSVSYFMIWTFCSGTRLALTMAHCQQQQQQQRKQETTTATTTRDNTTTFASDSCWAHVEAKMRPVLPVPEKKNSSPAALWLIPSNWSRSTAGCLWLPLAINTYSFGYGYRRVWGITTRTSRNINININIRVRIRIEIEWNNYCGFKFAELDILWHYSRAERSVSNCIVCRVIELVVHKIESLDWPPPERKFMNYAHPLPHANILSTYWTESWVNIFALWGNNSHF